MGLCDDAIAALERDLAGDDDDSGSSSSDDESDDGSASSGDDDGAVAPAVVAEGVLASLRDERIASRLGHGSR